MPDARDLQTQLRESLAERERLRDEIRLLREALDRLTSETTPQGTVSYTYDAAGRRSTMTVAGQSAVNYTYDSANRLTQISQGSATVSLAYDTANRRTSLTLPNGIVAAYGYDAASRVTSITYTLGGTTVGSLTHIYDADGRRVSMGGSLASANLPAALASTTYNANNQLTAWGSSSLSYDLNGNMTSDGTTTHTWDARNQLSAYGSITFAYDGLGRRIQNASGKAFLYDGPTAVQELSGSTVTANLLTGLGVDETFTRTDSAGVRNFLTDSLGSAVALTDSSGTVQTQYSYEPFGKTTASGASSANTFQYIGRENDGASLYYYRARYYNPTLQRFISEDPIWFAGGDVDLYAHVANDPTDLVDSSGHAGTAYVNITDGRSPGDFPTNGNWGGLNWSGGWYPPAHGGKDGPLPPLDSGDEAYMRHDKCYGAIDWRTGTRYDKKRCDANLVKDLKALPSDSSKWPHPPPPGTKLDSEVYRETAIIFFGAASN